MRPGGRFVVDVFIDVQCPVLQRQAPRPALADGVRALASQNGHQLPELPRTQPAERATHDGSAAVSTPATVRSSHLDHAGAPASDGTHLGRPDGVGMRASRAWLMKLRWESCCTSVAGGRHSRSLKELRPGERHRARLQRRHLRVHQQPLLPKLAARGMAPAGRTRRPALDPADQSSGRPVQSRDHRRRRPSTRSVPQVAWPRPVVVAASSPHPHRRPWAFASLGRCHRRRP